ncbi:hypothetical protein [Streptomyces sp. NPDC002851]
MTAADVRLMLGLTQRVTASRPELVNADASFDELAWNWGKGHVGDGASWRRRLWCADGDLVAWSWAHLPHQLRRSDGSVKDVTGAYLAYQVHPDHAGLARRPRVLDPAQRAGPHRRATAGAARRILVLYR